MWNQDKKKRWLKTSTAAGVGKIAAKVYCLTAIRFKDLAHSYPWRIVGVSDNFDSAKAARNYVDARI